MVMGCDTENPSLVYRWLADPLIPARASNTFRYSISWIMRQDSQWSRVVHYTRALASFIYASVSRLFELLLDSASE